MYIRKADGKSFLKSAAERLVGGLKDRFDFLLRLYDEDDWSFVIKLHALIEASTTQLIVRKVGHEAIRASIERMPLSGDEVSKLRLTKDLGLYTKEKRTFVRRLSTLRNLLVHNVANVDFKFASYIATLSDPERKAWKDAVCWFRVSGSSADFWRQASIDNPKLAVWMAGFLLVSLSVVDENEIEGRRTLNDLASQASDELLKAMGSSGET